MEKFNLNSTIGEVKEDFGKEGKLLFPVDRDFKNGETLKEISDSSHYIWYSHINPVTTVDIINYLAAEKDKRQIFYPIYSAKEIEQDPSKSETGLYFFKGKKDAPFAINNAGGGFAYVAAMQDSFPHASYLSQKRYNAFALIYRPTSPYEDLARAITFIYDHTNELEIDKDHYSLWGGSAGARMAAELGNLEVLRQLTQRADIPQADSVIMQYTGFSRVSRFDAPTYVCVGDKDWIANWETMKMRLFYLRKMGIPTEFHVYHGLGHGFGLGSGTAAEGWINDAIRFWQSNMKRK